MRRSHGHLGVVFAGVLAFGCHDVENRSTPLVVIFDCPIVFFGGSPDRECPAVPFDRIQADRPEEGESQPYVDFVDGVRAVSKPAFVLLGLISFPTTRLDMNRRRKTARADIRRHMYLDLADQPLGIPDGVCVGTSDCGVCLETESDCVEVTTLDWEVSEKLAYGGGIRLARRSVKSLLELDLQVGQGMSADMNVIFPLDAGRLTLRFDGSHPDGVPDAVAVDDCPPNPDKPSPLLPGATDVTLPLLPPTDVTLRCMAGNTIECTEWRVDGFVPGDLCHTEAPFDSGCVPTDIPSVACSFSTVPRGNRVVGPFGFTICRKADFDLGLCPVP